MNVLIYSGSGSSYSIASKRLKLILSRLLSGSHDIKLANSQLISRQPWQRYTSLLVFPANEEIEAHPQTQLSSETRRSIIEYVQNGGKILGIGKGVQLFEGKELGLGSVVWKQVDGQMAREVKVNDTLPGEMFGDFVIPSQAVIETQRTSYTTQIDPMLLRAGQVTNLAHYSQGLDHIGGICCHILNGLIALIGFDISESIEWLTFSLHILGLEGIKENSTLQDNSSMYLVSVISSTAVTAYKEKILSYCSAEDDLKKHISIINNHNDPVPPLITFDWSKYFRYLKQDCCDDDSTLGLGCTVLYAETMESTQNLLEKNSNLIDAIPSGTVVITANQTYGRGRGSNSWVSTEGSVQFSLLIKIEEVQSGLVFVQYLFGLAVVEWLRAARGLNVRLKWPNDIYGSRNESDQPSQYKKLGGILVNCSYGGWRGTECRIIIGCGINNISEPHSSTTTSLKSLIYKGDDSSDKSLLLGNEEIISGIHKHFQKMWIQFKMNCGFKSFERRYYDNWLHTDQIILHERTGDKLKIIGISPTHGLLRTIRVSGPSEGLFSQKTGDEIVDLQPDSNSFDIFSGLIRSKE
ncbi:biotin-apo protein ligase [Phakopsora pachyrhizi]|uniref:Biotin-apo protein ligase n=1 Tax=Phakopsora pachyrhizi TaxID=170000 RepID=A0AAV0AS55_PHAPC|nr:biotin-apo protein ligase [Phakopsora pachyrhizi]